MWRAPAIAVVQYGSPCSKGSLTFSFGHGFYPEAAAPCVGCSRKHKSVFLTSINTKSADGAYQVVKLMKEAAKSIPH